MIPSLVVNEITDGLVEYLSTTFALSDDDVRVALERFLTDHADGIFRGPYLRVRLPFEAVEDEWQSPLDWLPDGFRPYAHQAAAFDRLSSAGERTPLPTIVTTGTGSGKTECFLYPILDHCARLRPAGRPGVKALLLYPMNALASDQAGRIAGLIAKEAQLAGVTAGLYIGEVGSHASMGPDHIIDKKEVLQATPPDVLLTNYKMLDFLLLRRADRELWAEAGVQYVVLDEFHTYDGAQGTDVAMLLRRLGKTLGVARADAPLGDITPVATSATLGTGPTSTVDLRSFAERVFGCAFPEESVVTERRQSVEQACRPVNYMLPIPDPHDVADVDDLEEVAAAFCVPLGPDGEPDAELPASVEELGERLLEHPLTRAVLAAVGDRSRSWPATVAEVVTRAPEWGRAAMRDPQVVERALGRYVWLLSVARRSDGDAFRPLLSVEVQLWIREVSRVLRAVQTEPHLRWRDSSAPEIDESEPSMVSPHELPAVYCRRCGMSGWMALQSELGDTFIVKPNTIYQASLNRSATQRVLLRCHADEPGARHYDPAARRFASESGEHTVPVLVTPTEDDAKRSTCPACTEPDAIRFLGLQVASLASVSINTIFGSDHVHHDERKLLAFTDSVQDASHRAAFFAGRTHRFNLRARMAQAVERSASVTLADLGDGLFASPTTLHDWHGLVPPDLLRHPHVKTVWTDAPTEKGKQILRERLGFEVTLEFGLRSRVGRTLELSGAVAAAVDIPNLDEIAGLVAEDLRARLGVVPPAAAGLIHVYLRGLVERLRLRGGIMHPLLDPYVRDNGRLWHVWGGRPDGLPPFTPGQGRPLFATTASRGDFDSLTSTAATPTWYVDWAMRCLGLDASEARTTNQRAFSLLGAETEAVVETVAAANRVYGLDPCSVSVADVSDDDGLPVPSLVQCDHCGHRHAAPPETIESWHGTPCLRYRCPGSFEVAEPRSNYYRRLYRSGHTPRVVTGEHTGLLKRAQREALETAFKAGTAPDAPNVIAATPTLEMGIDIGDLSAVMLTSVPPRPASYIQRVGRAGRRSGNALITTFVRGDSHGLYYLAEPEAMIAGEVRPPNCFLDATETLHRQYVAFLMDRVADLTLDAPTLPGRVRDLMTAALDQGSFLRRIADASTLDSTYVETFIELFGLHIAPQTADDLRAFASEAIEVALKEAVEAWNAEYRELGLRRDRINEAIKRIEALTHRSGDEEEQLKSLRGQRAAIVKLRQEAANEYTLSALERLGVLPNYTLIDDAASLKATMWWRDDDGEYHVDDFEYQRPARLAITEFAPANSFYAGGHRHRVDALEIGRADQPLYETWRLCPECGYGTAEVSGVTIGSCPRCGGAGVADTGTRHVMLRLRTARSSGSEENARVYDESDEREREHYDVLATVDVDPAFVSGAWQLQDRAFGAEFARRTHIRTINLGFSDRTGERIPIAGAERHVTRFKVCTQCGAASDARDDKNGSRTDRLHHGWCKVRSGSVAARWESIVLYHELVTEAVRLLVPVSMFEVDERLASFKAALMLGLREDFGGEVDHLSVIRHELPNRAGQGHYRFLVLYDAVPGGTGYLDRLADPDRVRQLLEAGRRVIARCPCQGEGRAACHRCLLGVVDRHEYELVSRELALELLDDLLGRWTPDTSIDSVAAVDIAKVEESELERRFKVALQDWAARTDGATMLPAPGKGGHDAFELRIRVGGEFRRYRIDEQEGLSTSPSTQPDYLIRRVDEPGREIAIYLDGYQFHASTEVNNLAADAEKRAGVRVSGRLVWNLTWADVVTFHEAVVAEIPKQPSPRPLLRGTALLRAKELHAARSGNLDFVTVDKNPSSLLIEYLLRPNDTDWQRLALSAVGGFAADAGLQPVAADSIEPMAHAFTRGDTFDPPAADQPVALAARGVTLHGMPLGVVLDAGDPNAERWTAFAVIPDDATSLLGDEHRERWRDWLQWANVLQFLGPIDSERTAWIRTTSQARSEAVDDLWVMTLSRPGPTPSGTPAAGLSADIQEQLDEILDAQVRAFVEQAAVAGAPPFVVGDEVAGIPVEVAWPDRQIGVMVAGDERRVDGWDVRPVDRWTLDELLERLRG